jgi:hypothetical protein
MGPRCRRMQDASKSTHHVCSRYDVANCVRERRPNRPSFFHTTLSSCVCVCVCVCVYTHIYEQHRSVRLFRLLAGWLANSCAKTSVVIIRSFTVRKCVSYVAQNDGMQIIFTERCRRVNSYSSNLIDGANQGFRDLTPNTLSSNS